MSTLRVVSSNQEYLLITGPNNFDKKEFKELRQQANELLLSNGLSLVIQDLRETDLASAKLLCIDDIAQSSRLEMPACSKLAIVSNPSSLMDHYLNVNACVNGAELEMFNSIQAGEKWLLQ